MLNNKRKKKILGTPFQKKLLTLVFASATIPALIISACMYYLIFHLLAWQLVFPDAIAYNLMPVLREVNLILLVSVPLSVLLIWFVALELSHRIAGPLYRIEKELDQRIAGARRGPIKLRKNDEFQLLVEKINKLICE